MAYIKSIKFKDHYIFNNSEININLSKTNNSNNHLTVIIGENGTGKSELLKEIVELFRSKKSGSRGSQQKSLHVDLKPARVKSWPKKLIASSFSLNDKFPFVNKDNKNEDKGFYKYLGIRTASNNAFTGKIRDELFTCMMKIFSNQNKLKKFINIIETFDLPITYTFEFSYSRGLDDLFKRPNIKTSKEITNNIINNLMLSRRFNLPALERMQEDSSFETNVLTSINKTFKEGKKTKIIKFDLDDVTKLHLPENATEMEFMLNSRLVSIKEFSPGGDVKFQHMSSGQFHILKSVITIISEIEDDSLILIDEPEISLHPSWQMNYMSVLNDMISGFKNCHVFVATHSHLIVTTLPIKNSDVIISRKRKDNKEIYFESFEGTPSGWSSDMILYSAFGVINKNNQSFDYDIDQVASFMSNWKYSKENLIKLQHSVRRLSQYKLPDNDPLSVFILKSEDFLAKVIKDENL
ncbi:TPA: ATP-binding protein [Enterobacter asburiae]|nr:ATP-binding protein [Enterobacter asburiae]